MIDFARQSNLVSSPNNWRETDDLPAPDGPTISPTFQSRSSIGISPFHA
jgi:hypothetical protein